MQTQQYLHHLPMWNGYIIDARISWWKIQSRRQVIVLIVTGELYASNAGRSTRVFAESHRPVTRSLLTFVASPSLARSVLEHFLRLTRSAAPPGHDGRWSRTRPCAPCWMSPIPATYYPKRAPFPRRFVR